jgi:hypothetical protein
MMLAVLELDMGAVDNDVVSRFRDGATVQDELRLQFEMGHVLGQGEINAVHLGARSG